MSDLVEQLRNGADDHVCDKLMREAADEIERLRSLLGAVTPGQTVADIKEYLRKGQKEILARMKDELSSDVGERTAP